MKDNLQLDGDIHVLNEKIDKLQYDSYQYIDKLHSDSYQYIDKLNNKINDIDKEYKYHLEAIINRIKYLEKQDKRTTNDINNDNQRYTELVRLIKLKEPENNILNKRIEKLEKHFENHNFHLIIDELENLEKEYQEKAKSIISKLAFQSKEQEKVPLSFELLFQPISHLEMTVRASASLRGERFEFIGDIVCHDNLEMQGRYFYKLLRIYNFGHKSYNELMTCLKLFGFEKSIICPEYWKERHKRTGSSFEGKFKLLDEAYNG